VLNGQGGAYNVPTADLAAARQIGISLVLGSDHDPAPSAPSSSGSGIRYIDNSLWALIQQYTPPSCQSVTTPCSIPPAGKQALMNAVNSSLAKVRGNASIAAFDILDDYPGNIVDILSEVHAMVAADNRTEASPRPTICPIGATLDSRQQPGGPWTSHHNDQRRGLNIDTDVLNFSPSACDYVSLYPFSPLGFQDDQVDWSMTQLLPYMLSQLSARGWNPAGQPLIGTPQTFGYTNTHWGPPTGAEVKTQTDAFCQTGARAIIAYAWNDTATEPKLELFNDADMRSGFAQALSDCRRTWAGA
jgi:hypothetical protein